MVVRRFYEVLNSGRPVDELVEELRPDLHPEAEYVNPSDALESGVRRGIDEWRAVLRSVTEGLGPTAQYRVEDVTERGDQVFVILALRTGGTQSGVEVAGPTIGTVWTVRDGLVHRVEWCWNPADARAIFEGEVDG